MGKKLPFAIGVEIRGAMELLTSHSHSPKRHRAGRTIAGQIGRIKHSKIGKSLPLLQEVHPESISPNPERHVDHDGRKATMLSRTEEEARGAKGKGVEMGSPLHYLYHPLQPRHRGRPSIGPHHWYQL